jgi:hypothetical protein
VSSVSAAAAQGATRMSAAFMHADIYRGRALSLYVARIVNCFVRIQEPSPLPNEVYSYLRASMGLILLALTAG